MNLVYADSAFPFGKLSDWINHKALLALGMLVLAQDDHGVSVLLGVGLIWDLWVGAFTFYMGVVFAALTWLALLTQPRNTAQVKLDT
jgi:hypothetical protein